VADILVDILIIGGGLTGAILQLALVDKGYSCLVVDANPPGAKVSPDFDARSLALSPASVRILQMLDIWPLLKPEAEAIARIHVSEQGRFGSTNIRAKAEIPLGYVAEMQHINGAIYQLINQKQQLFSSQLKALDKEKSQAIVSTKDRELVIKAKLIVAADGTQSAVRKLTGLSVKIKDYQQQALVANIGLARPHQNVAYEHFTASGPLALLPMTAQRVSLVWALPPAEAKQLAAVDETTFLRKLQQAFGYRLGRFERVGKRVIYPLQQLTMPSKIAWPLVFVGNAAHTLHPVAGQGFNLGLRDVASLAQCIVQEGLTEAMLFNYQKMRQHDEWAITQFTNGLIDVFTSRLPGMAMVRNLGLLAVDNLAVLKNCLTHYTRGFAGITPNLVCGISLDRKESQ
jgi:2-octaprenyl-6-methoxyphenol hydroxylase